MKKILYCFVALYITFFSVFSVVRYRNMYANYFDLGIMHHVVYNSYQAIRTGEWSRFLEHTDPNGSQQVIRSAVHNDIILGLFAPLYFLSPSPEVLLIAQSIALGLGAIVVFGIAEHLLSKRRHHRLFAFVFAITYLFYPPLQLMNRFDFHAVALATPFLLFMIHFWLCKRYRLSILFLVLSLITKEQVGLTTAVFGGWIVVQQALRHRLRLQKFVPTKESRFGMTVIVLSVFWVLFSFTVMIPFFRGGGHFALSRYENIDLLATLFRQSTIDYVWNIFGPVGFLSLLSPTILIAVPEFSVNLLSQDSNMRSIVFHYTAVLIPFVYLAALSGSVFLARIIPAATRWIVVGLLGCTVWFSVTMSPLPYSQQRDLYVFNPQQNAHDAREWAYRLRDDSISVSATGNVGTFLSSRRRFYYFSQHYPLADYVIIRPNEVFSYHDKETLIPVYQRLIRDPRYVLVDRRENFEVYKKL